MKTKRFAALVLLMLMTAVVLTAAGHSVSLSWTASVAMPGTIPSGSGYNVYRLSGSCPASLTSLSGWTKLTPTPVTTLTYVDSTVTAGKWCYDVTASLNGVESDPSNDPQATVPLDPPTNVIITNQQ